jgi:hypothetical protein
MSVHKFPDEAVSDATGHTEEGRPILAGVDVREEDLEPQRGLHVAAIVFRICSVIIFVLAIVQFAIWWADRPPGGVGIGMLVGDTIRLIVFSALLWAAGDLADLLIKTHYDVRAGRVLLTRQTHMMRQFGVVNGVLPVIPPVVDRRGLDPVDSPHPPDQPGA